MRRRRPVCVRGTALVCLAASATMLLGVVQDKGPRRVSGPVGQATKIRVVPQTSQTLIMDIQESSNETRLLTSDRKLAPRLWDAKSLKLLLVLRGHADPIRWLSFSPDGKTIATLSGSEVRLWDSTKAKPEGVIQAPSGGAFTTAAFSPDSKSLAVGCEDGLVRVCPVSSPISSKDLKGHRGSVTWIQYSPDGSRLVTCSADTTARVWDADSGTTRTVLAGSKSTARWADVSRDGSLTVVSTLDDKARVYETGTGKLLYEKAHAVGERSTGNVLMGAVFVQGPDEMLLVASSDGKMSLLSPLTGQVVGTLEGHTATLREIRVSRDRTRVATYADDQNLFVWDVKGRKRLPFEEGPGGPTAGEFSPKGEVFWVGYEDGAIRAHDLTTGQYDTQALGSVFPIYGAVPIADGKGLALSCLGTWWLQNSLHGSESKVLNSPGPGAPVLSADGRYALYSYSEDSEWPGRLIDVPAGKSIIRFHAFRGAAFSPDSSRFVVWYEKGEVNFFKSADGDVVKSWVLDKERPVSGVAFVGGPEKVVSWAQGSPTVQVWNADNGSVEANLDFPQVECGPVAASRDGSMVAAYGSKGLRIWNLASKAPVDGQKVETRDVGSAQIEFSPSGQYVAVIDGGRLRVWSSKTGALEVDVSDSVGEGSLAGVYSRDGSQVVSSEGTRATVTDVATGKALLTMDLTTQCTGAFFLSGGTRIATVDDTDGLTLWESSPDQRSAEVAGTRPSPKRIGNFVILRGDGWLAYDADGRFDTDDPSHVSGACFVKEWDGGLEAISMDQLKSGFYEPGLFAKMLGFDTEPARDVPDLDGLRLYPSIALAASPEDPLKVKVSLRDRDDGGIGKVLVTINGKQVVQKKGTGAFTVDVNELSSYLLPETYLPTGNVLQVTASNEAGSLTSLPVTFNLGFPKGLKTPDVRMHVLCVGIGDYAGEAGDLKAPPSDAAALADAVIHAGEKLLPGRVDATLLSTASGAQDRPTRVNIERWFTELANHSTSSDIVLVFLSGHGTNQIGETKGYFFLTSEADPGDVDPSAIGTATVSGEDLRAWLSKVPATKQVVILDTCHSGAAAGNLVGSDRSVSGDYQRAWESIKDATGTWMLAGSAADQLSYESPNVDHGMLTYSLLEAIDKVSADGMRPGSGGEYFLDVERWLGYAAERVESLKTEVGLSGIQRPEFKRSTSGTTFDIGVAAESERGRLHLKPPLPIVILGEFESNKEDPLNLEGRMQASLRDSAKVKGWFDVAKHPKVYRVAAEYNVTEGTQDVTVKVYLQFLDAEQKRKTLETFDVAGVVGELGDLVKKIRSELEDRINKIESSRLEKAEKPASSSAGGRPLGL